MLLPPPGRTRNKLCDWIRLMLCGPPYAVRTCTGRSTCIPQILFSSQHPSRFTLALLLLIYIQVPAYLSQSDLLQHSGGSIVISYHPSTNMYTSTPNIHRLFCTLYLRALHNFFHLFSGPVGYVGGARRWAARVLFFRAIRTGAGLIRSKWRIKCACAPVSLLIDIPHRY